MTRLHHVSIISKGRFFFLLLIAAISVVGLSLVHASKTGSAQRLRQEPQEDPGSAKMDAHPGSVKFSRPDLLKGQKDKPHILAASYYNLRDGMKTTLTLNNKGPNPLRVKPTLYNLAGESLDIPSVLLEANSHQIIDLSEWIASGGPDFLEGSLQLFYKGKDLLLGAQVKVIDDASSLIFDEQLVEPKAMFSSSQLEGVWWLPSSDCRTRLILSNTTDSPLTVTVTVSGASPEQQAPVLLSLQPHETRVANLRDYAPNHPDARPANLGGVSVKHSGQPGALLARGLIEETARGYSSVIHFADPQQAKSSSLHGAGLRLGRIADDSLTPIIIARNIGGAPTVVKGRMPYTTNDGRAGVLPLSDLHLQPGEARVLDLNSDIRGVIADNISSAGLEFDYNTQPGSVIISALSMGKSGSQVFQVPMLDPAAQHSSTGGYPWRIEDTSSTVVYIKNVSDEPQHYVAHLTFPGGDYVIGRREINPGQTVALDIRALRDSNQPDENGVIIPSDAGSGQFKWSLTQSHASNPLVLIGRAEQVDVIKALASSYACQNCCTNGVVDAFIQPSSAGIPVNSQVQFRAYQTDVDCYGNRYTYSCSASWSSSDTNIATINSSGLATGRNAGQVTITASWTGISYEPPLEPCGPYLVSGTVRPSEPDPCGCFSRAVFLRPRATLQVLFDLRGSIPQPLVSGDADSTISGRTFTFQVEVINPATGQRATNVSGHVTVNFPVPGLIQGESISPNPVPISQGVGQTQVVLRVVDTGPSFGRSYTLSANGCKPGGGLVKVWFRVEMDVERWKNCGFQSCPNLGSYFCTTACVTGGFPQPTSFVALTARVCGSSVMVRNTANNVTQSAPVQDVGPVTNNPYWNNGMIPSTAGCITDVLANSLGVQNGCNPGPYGRATVLWRFQ